MTQPSDSARRVSPGVFAGLAGVTAAAALVAATAGTRLYQNAAENADWWPLFLWGLSTAVVGAATLLWAKFTTASEAADGTLTPPDKLAILSMGGLTGLLTVLVIGGFYGMKWWTIMTGGREAWATGWKPWVPVAGVVGGLALMFVAVLAVKSEERTTAWLRQVLYGYNAFLTGLIVLAILGVLNLIVFFHGSTYLSDWTSSHIYEIAPSTKELLKELDRPVKVYVILGADSDTRNDVRTLLANCERYTDKLTVTYLDPNNPRSDREINTLISEYNLLDLEGILIVYEGEPKAHQFLKRIPDLEELPTGMDPNERKRSFKGEQALWTALKSLREGKATTTLYVTQDSGELNLDEQGGERYDQGLGRLKEKLEKEGFKLQAASLTPDPKTGAAAKIPTDGVLLLAGPQGPMPEPKAQALRQFLKDGGKAIILADVNKDPRLEPVVPAGQQALEAVLAEYGVRLGRDVALTLINPEDPTAITAMFASRGADTGFAGGLVVERMEFLGVRSVRPAEGQTAFQVNPLYVTPKMVQQGVGAMTVTFTEEALRASPRQLIADLRAGKDEQRLNQIVNGPIFPVAVTVREQATPNPMDPHAALRQGGTGNPKLVVFGDATFVSNKAIANPQTGDLSYRILATTLAWLRGKSTAVEGAPPPKVRDTYKLNVSSQEELDTLRYLPGLVALLGVAFVGAGVWFMRRR